MPKPYPAYKDTGVPWLGDVPVHWEILPNRALFVEVNEREHPDEQMLSVTITQGVIRQRTLLEDSSKKDSSKQDKSAYQLVCSCDIVYNKMRAWQGAIGVSDFRGIVSPAYVVVRLRKANHPRYFHYLFRTPQFAKEAERWSYGITSDMWSLRPEHFKMIYCSLPPLPEQTAIVRFLDHMDRRIRRYIRAKQKLIKLLEEQKQAIIHRVVTRGLDPNVRFKPSGVEWLGNIPEHWEVRRLKNAARLIMGQSPSSEDCSPEQIGLPFLQGCAEFGLKSPNPKQFCRAPAKVSPPGAILLAVRAPVGRLNVTNQPYGIGRGLCAIQPDGSVWDADYALYALSTSMPCLAVLATGSTYDAVSIGDVGSILTLLPPLPEQSAVVRYLNTAAENLSRALDSAYGEISLLREYCTRLFADVVTGKLDVREAAANLTEESEDTQVLTDFETRPGAEEAAEDLLTDDMPQEGEQ